MVLVRLLAIVALVLFNGFFVAAEFALVRSRRTRLEARAAEGDRLAGLALRGTTNISSLLSASQLGVTLASLGLGWVAEAAFSGVLGDALGALPFAIELPLRITIAGAIALAAVTYLHVVFGELAPKGAALVHPEELARWFVPLLMVWAWLTTPFTALLNRSAQAVLRLTGRATPQSAEDSVHSPEELRLLVEQAQEGGALEQHDAALLDAVFEFSEKNAREVMTPRTDIVALPSDATLDQTLTVVTDGGFSRYPVYTETIDSIVGILLAKDLLQVARNRPAAFTPASIMRRAHVIPGSREVEAVLGDFKRLKEHMAIVLDEYGAVEGIVTLEDLLEELVGEITDEFDVPDETVEHVDDTTYRIDGTFSIDDFNEQFRVELPIEDYHTVAGFVFGQLGRAAEPGDEVAHDGIVFHVDSVEGQRIDRITVTFDRQAHPPDEVADADS